MIRLHSIRDGMNREHKEILQLRSALKSCVRVLEGLSVPRSMEEDVALQVAAHALERTMVYAVDAPPVRVERPVKPKRLPIRATFTRGELHDHALDALAYTVEGANVRA